jgi:spore coat polysaccharide biosynthesis protein SpsF
MILAILQARMSSTRLPGKVMKPLLGEPMIGRQIERVARSRRIDRLAVATSVEPGDDPLAAYCEALGVGVFRGPLDDVLSRFMGAAEAFGPADHIVRLTADCPLADPDVIDACIDLHLAAGADYTTNGQQRTYPTGLDVEALPMAALATAAREASDAYDREHVTPYLYRRPERFKLAHLTQDTDTSRLRWTVDHPEDFDFVERVYAALYPDKPDFRMAEVLALDLPHALVGRTVINQG